MKANIRRRISALCLLATLAAQTAFGYYDPTLQRWLTLDPIGEPGGINLYAFNNNAPVNWVDPDGESPTLVSGGIGFVAGGIIGGGVAWWRGVSIWKGAVKGAVVGGVAGLTGGAAGGAAARFLAARGVNAMVVGAGSGAVGGMAGDVAAQGTEMFMGDRCRFNAVKTVTFGAVGGVLGGGVAAWSAPKPALVPNPRYVQLEFPFARGASIQTPGVTRAGEIFVRVGAQPRNLKFGSTSLSGAQPGTYAFPKATFNRIEQDPFVLKNLGDLPGAAPQYFRILRPPPGPPIQRGIVPGG